MAGGTQSNKYNKRKQIARMSSFDICPEGNFYKGVNNITWSRTNNNLNVTTVQTSFRYKT
jgi:hypothetical protein